MHISRRNFLAASVSVPVGLALASCSTTGINGGVTITQTVLNAAAAIEAGLAGIKGLVAPNTQADITKAIGEAEGLLGGLVPGTLVPLTSVQNVFTDLETVQQAVAKALPGNPIVIAVGVALTVLAGIAQMAMPAGAAIGAQTPDQAVHDLLTNLRYNGRIKIVAPS